MIRIGHGYDVHRFKPERKLILGGAEIPFDMGLDGHSDADVLLHAVCDSILGALSLGDIGVHFPDSDMSLKDINSMILLEKVAFLMYEKGYSVNNIDCTVICQKPKLMGYIPKMRSNIAKVLNTAEENINVKATTEEGLGFTGEMLGIAAHAVCTVKSLSE